MCLKSAADQFFSLFPNRYCLDLLKKVLYVHFGQGSVKLWVPKLWPCQDSNLGRPESSDSLYELTRNVVSDPKGLEFFLTANFQRPQFCSPLS